MNTENPSPSRTDPLLTNRRGAPERLTLFLALLVLLLVILADLLIAAFFSGDIRLSLTVQLLIGFGEMLRSVTRPLAGVLEGVSA